jgi:invasion protein IalB
VQGDVGNYAEFDIMVPQVSTERTGCYLKYATTINSTTLARSGEVIGLRSTAQVDNAVQISSAGAGLTGNFLVLKIT